MYTSRYYAGLCAVFLFVAGCSTTAPVQQPIAQQVRVDTVIVEVPAPAMDLPGVDVTDVKAGRFDNGKMWTFDNPPLDYFKEAYNFEPDEAWFAKARLGALRIPGCSASFVSPYGLVMTNHHCARESVSQVSEEDEHLLDNGFYATSLDAERRIEDYYADQLISITDVTAEVDAALMGQETDAERVNARTETIEAIETRMAEEAGGEDAGITVEVIELYNGGQYSAYTFRRYNDVRLVAAPELQIGYFGGDPDNFTFPRYNLDFSFYRIYENDQPLETENHFAWSLDGVQEGDAVFLIGNPGSTSRLQTVAQLEYRRDYEEPYVLNLLESRVEAMQEFADAEPEMAEEMDLINTIFSLENAIKAYTGRLEGLQDPVLMARRMDTERQFREALAADSALQAQYGTLLEGMASIKAEMATLTGQIGAFNLNPESPVHATTLARAMYGYLYALQRSFGVPEENLADLKETLLTMDVNPPRLDIALTAAHFEDMVYYLGEDHPAVQAVLKGQTPEGAARMLVTNTAVLDNDAFEAMLADFTNADDPAVAVGEALGQGLVALQPSIGPLAAQEGEVAARIARARFDVYGTVFPPDATFSLRISDGVVAAYAYNGTQSPIYTTFYGLYDRYYAHQKTFPWHLPERWIDPPAEFDLSTPVNFVSTNDIIGGNSGSPVLNTDLEVVGLAFDSNIEGLPGEFIYTDEVARTVSVDARGIIEALDVIYDADRIVEELLSGRLIPTEAEADRVRAQ